MNIHAEEDTGRNAGKMDFKPVGTLTRLYAVYAGWRSSKNSIEFRPGH